MKKDCFAYSVNYARVPICIALTSMQCRGGGWCEFYKNKERYLKDLQERHGTTSIKEIVTKYSDGHQEEETNDGN